MNLEAQRYLAQQLAQLRESRRHGAGARGERSVIAHFSGALHAFRVVGAVSDEEVSDWMGRALEAAGGPPSIVGRASITLESGQVVGRVGPPRGAVPPPEDLPRFLRLVPAPNEEYEFYGGHLRIVGVELYETEMAVHWRMAPLPDVDAALPEDAEAAELDTLGLPEDERQRFRLKRQRDNWKLLKHFLVTDDAGHRYRSSGGGASGSLDVLVGRLILTPGLQEDATALVIDALGLVITV
ncbi:MAG: hypothetical protein ACREEC_08475, partial [Thermoplasmata archaeon]